MEDFPSVPNWLNWIAVLLTILVAAYTPALRLGRFLRVKVTNANDLMTNWYTQRIISDLRKRQELFDNPARMAAFAAERAITGVFCWALAIMSTVVIVNRQDRDLVDTLILLLFLFIATWRSSKDGGFLKRTSEVDIDELAALLIASGRTGEDAKAIIEEVVSDR